MDKIVSVVFMLFFLISCNKDLKIKEAKPLKIAFLSDVHLHDIYGTLTDNPYKGLLNSKTGKYTLARTMQSQLESTRLFNENYFAFKAALNDLVEREVKYVVLPGDFSDDGQRLNIRGLKTILNEYTLKYGLKFILTTGNHDPVRPFLQEGGKVDFLGPGGQTQAIFSNKELCAKNDSNDLSCIITKDMAKLGYEGILTELKTFGFQPNDKTVYWETPFTKYTYETYRYKEALDYTSLEKRTYKIQPSEAEIPDLSYLIEPENNLWFLAIDANVYIPRGKEITVNPNSYRSANVGYNNVLTHKKYLLEWIKSITKRAKTLGKTLIVFSHYPVVDFNDGATNEIKLLFGKDKMQMHRAPSNDVTKAFINAGVKVHFGGHMHINDTGVGKLKNGESIINVQIPSLAAYIPAYKLLKIQSHNVFEVETVVLNSVSDFSSLFPLYRQEYKYLLDNNKENIWNLNILNTSSYKEFTEWHLKEVVRLRFLKQDWPEELKRLLLNATGKKLIEISTKEHGDTKGFYKDLLDQNLQIQDFETWNGLDMVYDFYKIKNADILGIKDIGKHRMKQYLALSKLLQSTSLEELRLFGTIFIKFSSGKPADHFQIDMTSNRLTTINDLR
ncbi:metallophosphoesterase family protein [Aestuariibaculum sediminum]|uniref:Metallophosphoesterase n=1 Tax=Aestuariibaculum sediminum TaxID=2770637 RepID=A0A8J6U7M7_9FLAO|nr:metallophosphoesterase [Aestuariibaculum sediminum]MBD0832200.1 metallophosphoesterase [Aestuariibaculum sediminum]